MRNLHLLDPYRITSGPIIKHYGGVGDDTCGCFSIPSKIDRGVLVCIASSGMRGMEWEHVSVSRRRRTPNWTEMCQIKELFFLDTETAMQLHVPTAEHINDHPYCLHLWRPTNQTIPRPPFYTVGGCSRDEAKRLLAEAVQ